MLSSTAQFHSHSTSIFAGLHSWFRLKLVYCCKHDPCRGQLLEHHSTEQAFPSMPAAAQGTDISSSDACLSELHLPTTSHSVASHHRRGASAERLQPCRGRGPGAHLNVDPQVAIAAVVLRGGHQGGLVRANEPLHGGPHKFHQSLHLRLAVPRQRESREGDVESHHRRRVRGRGRGTGGGRGSGPGNGRARGQGGQGGTGGGTGGRRGRLIRIVWLTCVPSPTS